MRKSIYKFIITAIIILPVTISGCIQKDFEEPPESSIPVGELRTIADVHQIYYDSVVARNNTPYKFEKDYSVYANVSMDDKSGNIYKAAYIQDNTGAINLRLLSSGGLYQGDSIRLNLKGLVLSDYNNMIQLDSVHVDNNVTKIATKKEVEPEIVTIGQLTDRHYGRLIKIENVQFVSSDVGLVFANPQVSENRTIEDCNGNTLIVRNSGYANFAERIIPREKGSIIGILGVFNTDKQLYIRSISEVKFTQPRCGELDTIFSVSFEGVQRNIPINFEGWKNISETGNVKWLGTILDNGRNPAAKIESDGNINATWLILPRLSISANNALKFATQAQSNLNSEFVVLYSSNYDGGDNPQNATWTTLPAIIANPGNSGWVESGELDLPVGDIYIAFKFTGNSGSNALYYLDDIVVYNK